jgi:hypothetical protein
VSAWGDMGATWGDGPPAPRDGSRREMLRPAPLEPAPLEPGPLERTLADLRQSLEAWRRGEVPDPGVIEATRAYLAALDATPEEADP